MKTKDIKKGISLIVLIITIIVVIILAAVVILTLSKNNPIETAKEARFKEDLRTFQDELSLYISKQYTNAGGHWDGNISAKKYDDIVNYIPSFTKKYEGKFVINNNNLEYTNILDEKEKEYAQSLNVNKKISILPDEFRQVEYLESTGTQYIDTRYVPDANTKYEYEFSFCEIPENNTDIGATDVTNVASQYVSLGIYINGKIRFALHYYSKINIDFDTNFHSVVFNNQNHEIYVDNTKIYTFDYASNYANSLNLYLFATNSSNTSINMGKLAIKYMKIYDKNILKRNFIPCKSTINVINAEGNTVPADTKGLYDTVEGKFYTNQGTGEFIAGPDVE